MREFRPAASTTMPSEVIEASSPQQRETLHFILKRPVEWPEKIIMKQSASVLTRHLSWILAGFALALIAEIAWILRAIDQAAIVTERTLALIGLAAFAVAGLTAGLARNVPRRARREGVTSSRDFRTAA